MIEPRYQDSGVTIYLGEVRAVLAEIEAESVDAIVTSPPYYALRDYKLPPAAWGGDPDHAHVWGANVVLDHRGHSKGKAATDDARQASNGSFCSCGSWLGQLGLEPDPLLFVDHLVEVLRACRRVLKREGTVWLNLGDSYASKTRGSDAGWDKSRLTNPGYSQKAQSASLRSTGERHRGKGAGFKAKDRMMIPARVAIALADDGWYLRDEIIWAKTNPMPSSVEDRTTPAHEMVYLLSRSGNPTYWTHRDGRRVDRRPRADYVWRDATTDTETDAEPADWRTERMANGERRWRRVNRWEGHDYYYDQAAIREQLVSSSDLRKMFEGRERIGGRRLASRDPLLAASGLTHIGQRRSVGDAAAASAEIERRAFRDGRVPRGWDNGEGRGHNALVGRYQPPKRDNFNARYGAAEAAGDGVLGRNKRSVWSLGTEPYADAHYATFPTRLIEPMILAGVPGGGVVLDPFGGSGTVGLVAKRLGRRAVLIDLGEEYVEQAIRRTSHEFGVGGRELVDDGTAVPHPDGLWAVAE